VRTRRAVPGISRPAAAKREEHLLLAYPGRDIAVTALVVVLTAAVLAAVADHDAVAVYRFKPSRGVRSEHPRDSVRCR
jgi:hypothetical protein